MNDTAIQNKTKREDNPTKVGIYMVKQKEDSKSEFAVWNGKLWEMPGETWWRRSPTVFWWDEYSSDERPDDLPHEKSLRQIQLEIHEWSQRNFKDQTSKATGQVLGSLAPFMGICEEAGELSHVMLKRHQGIRGYDNDEKFTAERDDALADLLVYLCDFSNRENVDLQSTLNEVWSKVQKRDWEKNKTNAHEVAEGK